MRRRDEIIQFQQRRFRIGFSLEDIERGAGNLAAFQALVQIVFVDDAAARAIQNAHAVSHPGNGVLVDQVASVFGKRHVNGDEVGLPEDLLKIDQFETAREMRIRIDVRIVSNDVHAHGLALARDFTADAAEANDAQGLSCQLHTLELRFFPLPVLQRLIRLRNVAREGEQHRDRVFCSGCRRSARRVHDKDATFGGGIEIDIVHTDAGAADDPEAFCFLDEFPIHSCAAANDDALRIGDDVQQFLADYLLVNDGVDRIRALNEFNPGGIDAIQKKDLVARHRYMCVTKFRIRSSADSILDSELANEKRR